MGRRHCCLDQLPSSSPSTSTATPRTHSILPTTIVPFPSVFEIHLDCQTDRLPQPRQQQVVRWPAYGNIAQTCTHHSMALSLLYFSLTSHRQSSRMALAGAVEQRCTGF
eukprot:2935644-Amphidinium_carterae.1